jgi:hypothetical protein
LGSSPTPVPVKELLCGPFDTDTSDDLVAAIEQLINLSLINTIRTEDEVRYSIHQITRRFVNSDLPDLWRQ